MGSDDGLWGDFGGFWGSLGVPFWSLGPTWRVILSAFWCDYSRVYFRPCSGGDFERILGSVGMHEQRFRVGGVSNS